MTRFFKTAFLLVLTASAMTSVGARGLSDEAVDRPMTDDGRIVQAGPSAFIVNNALYLFPEAVDRVVALSDGNQGNGNFVADIDPLYEQKTVLPRRVNTETILAQRPDTVVMKNFMESTMGEPLSRMGMDALYLDLETPEAWSSDLVRIGSLFGNAERAAELQDLFDLRIRKVEEPLADLRPQDKPRTLLLYWSVRDGETTVNVPPLGWIQPSLVEMAGGEPVWRDADLGERWTRTGLEQIAAWDPDVIALAAYHTSAEDVAATIKDDPAWSRLRAVRTDRLLAFPADYHSWDQPDARWLLGLTWLAGELHPDRFPGLDMMEEARAFYRDMYVLDDADFERLIIPRLAELN